MARQVARAAALGLLLVPGALAAQTQGTPDFSIPTARPTSNPRAQGPVDADAPIIRTVPSPRPSPVPAPVPVASPTTAPASPTGAASAPRQGSPARPAAAPPRTVATAPPSAIASPSPVPGVAPTPAVPMPASSADAGSVPSISTIEPPPSEGSGASFWPWVAGGAGLLAALFAGLWWRSRRSAQVPQLEFIPPVVRAPAPPPPSPEPAPVAAAKLPEPELATAPVMTVQPGLGISLEARRMSASLMATTLSYTVTLTNNSPDTLSALAIEGDMIAAHASLPPEQQIASDTERLELRHALVTLAPGESAEFKGDFRLPLASLNPIRAGDAAFFVPLARLRVEASTPAGHPLVKVQTYVVGETGDTPGAGLRPFRLDLGPRTYSKVGQRAVN
ncbi:MAG: hypothetical protein ACKOOL_11105 [Novosphingobium sp.]